MQNETEELRSKNQMDGIVFGALSYLMWGVLPLYWKLLAQVPSDEILAHRIIWSFVFVTAILLFSKGLGKFAKEMCNKKSLVLMSLCSVLIAANWFTYIWAVNSGHVIETSMGYYINPLIAVFFGITILKEKLNAYKYISLALAAIGVILTVVRYGRVPWVALTLAITFALYGLLKKLIVVESLVGLAMETVILTPLALIYVAFKQINGTGALFNISLPTLLLLACAGVVTATPLLLFAKGAKRVELSTLGFLQYISPTITLILGVFVFKERFTESDFLCFGFIWAALVIYSLSNVLGTKGLSLIKNISNKFS